MFDTISYLFAGSVVARQPAVILEVNMMDKLVCLHLLWIKKKIKIKHKICVTELRLCLTRFPVFELTQLFTSNFIFNKQT